MGGSIKKVFKTKKPIRILLLGLDAAGKTTILYRLKLGEYVQAIPTIGFNVETIQYKNIRFDCWDAGGQERFRRLWHHYCKNSQALIFVVDSSDADRVQEAKEEFHRILKEMAAEAATIVLVLANKQDLPNCMSTKEVSQKLELNEVSGFTWKVEPTCATTGAGLFEGMDWLIAELTKSWYHHNS